jgi:hypothetical protein
LLFNLEYNFFLESLKKVSSTLLECEEIPSLEILDPPIDDLQDQTFKSNMNQNFNSGIDTVVYVDGVFV